MLEAIILLLLLIIVTFVMYYSNDGDVLSPAFLACFVYIVSCLAAIYDCYAWKTGITLTTVFTILLGLLCFVIPATFFSKCQSVSVAPAHPYKRILVPKSFTLVVFFFGVITSVFYVKAILGIANSGSGDWSSTMQSYRTQVSYGSGEDAALPSYIAYMFRLLMAFAYAYLFMFIYTYFIEKRFSVDYLLIPVLYCGVSLVQASRGQIIIFLFAGVVMYWILKKRFSGLALRIPFSKVVQIIVILIVGLFLFTVAGTLVGRTTVKTPFDSLACYVGGSIIGLDMFLNNPSAATSPSTLFGAETFRGIYAFLSGLFHNPEWNYSFQMEYRLVNGINIGNLYTAFRYYLHDFGYLGMVIFSSLQGLFFGVYYRLLTNGLRLRNPFSLGSLLIVFAYLYIAIVYFPLADYLFHQYLNPTTVLTLAMFTFAVFILCKFEVIRHVSNEIDCN